MEPLPFFLCTIHSLTNRHILFTTVIVYTMHWRKDWFCLCTIFASLHPVTFETKPSNDNNSKDRNPLYLNFLLVNWGLVNCVCITEI